MRHCHERPFSAELRARRTALRLSGMPPFTGQNRVLGAAGGDRRMAARHPRLVPVANFSEQAIPLSGPESAGRLIYSSAAPGAQGSVSFHLSPSAAR